MATKIWLGDDVGNEGDWDTAANWSPSGVPGNADLVYLDGAISVQDVTAGLGQSSVTLGALNILHSYTGDIAALGTYLQIGATTVHLGSPSGRSGDAGSGRINLNFGSVQTEVNVYNAKTSATDTRAEPVRLLGTHAANVLNVFGGVVGSGTYKATEVSTWATVRVAQAADANEAAVNLGDGLTLGVIDQRGGSLTNYGANVTTLTLTAGQYRALQGCTHTTIDIDGGTVLYYSDGTIGTLRISDGGIWNTEADSRAKIVSACQMYKGSSFLADTGNPLSVTMTAGWDLVRCGTEDVTIRLGRNYTVTPSAI